MPPHLSGSLWRRVVVADGGRPGDQRLHGPHPARVERQVGTVPEGARGAHVHRAMHASASE